MSYLADLLGNQTFGALFPAQVAPLGVTLGQAVRIAAPVLAPTIAKILALCSIGTGGTVSVQYQLCTDALGSNAVALGAPITAPGLTPLHIDTVLTFLPYLRATVTVATSPTAVAVLFAVQNKFT
jgi:hypothetical protein